MRESVRGRSAALATVHIAAARFAREQIKRTDTLGPYAPPNAPQRTEGLEQLAKALEALAPLDQRTYALSLIQSYLGGDSGDFTLAKNKRSSVSRSGGRSFTATDTSPSKRASRIAFGPGSPTSGGERQKAGERRP
jgi:hypothetical protein